MRTKTNLLWKSGMLLAWTAVVVAYYVEVPEVRRSVNEHLQWVREYFRPTAVLPDLAPAVVNEPPAPVAPAIEAPTPPSAMEGEPAVAQSPELSPAPLVEPPQAAFDLESLASDRSAWPRTVQLKEPATFPAVQDARVIGKVRLPAGTVVNLARISRGKLGLEYRGGGAWVNSEQTDLVEQLFPARKLLSAAP